MLAASNAARQLSSIVRLSAFSDAPWTILDALHLPHEGDRVLRLHTHVITAVARPRLVEILEDTVTIILLCLTAGAALAPAAEMATIAVAIEETARPAASPTDGTTGASVSSSLTTAGRMFSATFLRSRTGIACKRVRLSTSSSLTTTGRVRIAPHE